MKTKLFSRYLIYCILFISGIFAGVVLQHYHIPRKTLDLTKRVISDKSTTPEIQGCTDNNAYNYNADATTDDGSCEYDVCLNINGVQKSLPEGYQLDQASHHCEMTAGYQALNTAFGDPVSISGPQGESYTSMPNSAFLSGDLSIDEYFYGKSITSQVDFFSGNSMEQKRDEIISQKETESYNEIIRSQFGMDQIDLGEITDVHNEVIEESESYDITYYQLTFSNGPIVQFYVGHPLAGNNSRVMLALHGCSSSPDKVMGISEPDYTNSFGHAALEEGWTVIAPFILTKCSLLDNMDAIGTLYAGATTFGYEIEKISSILDFLSAEIDLENLDVYGISFGAQLAALLSAVDIDIENMVFSGSMNFDLYTSYVNSAKDLDDSYTFKMNPPIYRFFSIGDILKAFIAKNGTKLVIEIGAFDALKKIDRGIIDENLEIVNWCDSEEGNCAERLFINYFEGYHETNPYPSLGFIR